MVLSNAGCNICIWQELERIKKKSFLLENRLQIKFVYYGSNLANALRFKKFFRKKDRIYLSTDTLLKEINVSNKYPFIIGIKNGIIIDSHFPIPADTTFSNLFYQRITKKF